MYLVIKINLKFLIQLNVIFILNYVINIEFLFLILVFKKCEVFCVVKDLFFKSVFNYYLLIIGNIMFDVLKRIKLCRCSFKKYFFGLISVLSL